MNKGLITGDFPRSPQFRIMGKVINGFVIKTFVRKTSFLYEVYELNTMTLHILQSAKTTHKPDKNPVFF